MTDFTDALQLPRYRMTKRGITLMQCRRPSVGVEESLINKKGVENFEHSALDLNYGKAILNRSTISNQGLTA